jgi:hypothetical protein
MASAPAPSNNGFSASDSAVVRQAPESATVPRETIAAPGGADATALAANELESTPAPPDSLLEGESVSRARADAEKDVALTQQEELGVVLENYQAAFGDAAQIAQPEAPVYFVTVNLTPQALRNNAVAELFGRNSIELVNTAPASGLVQLKQETTGRSASAPGAAEPLDATASHAARAEGRRQQAWGFLSDLTADQQNVRAVAVLADVGQANASEALEESAKYNRNAGEALSQVAGVWRFEAGGEPGRPIRIERQATPGTDDNYKSATR